MLLQIWYPINYLLHIIYRAEGRASKTLFFVYILFWPRIKLDIPWRIDSFEPILTLQHPIDTRVGPAIWRVAFNPIGGAFLHTQSSGWFIFEIIQFGFTNKYWVGGGCAPFIFGKTLVLSWIGNRQKKYELGRSCGCISVSFYVCKYGSKIWTKYSKHWKSYVSFQHFWQYRKFLQFC